MCVRGGGRGGIVVRDTDRPSTTNLVDLEGEKREKKVREKEKRKVFFNKE